MVLYYNSWIQERKAYVMRTIYILLTKTNSFLSRFIAATTNDPFTHSSISLDRELDNMYSFGRIHTYNPFKAGFVKENVDKGLFSLNKNSNCMLCSLDIPDSSYDEICKMIEQLKGDKDYKYNVLGLVYAFVKLDIPREKRLFCSEFVAHMLVDSGAIHIDTKPCQTKPSDFLKLKDVNPVYYGKLKNVAQM